MPQATVPNGDHGTELGVYSPVQGLAKRRRRELEMLQLIHSEANYSRLGLARKMDLSPAFITKMVRDLMAKGLVAESESVRSPAGRRPIPLSIRSDAGHLVGVDIGSFYTHVVVTNLAGGVIGKLRIETGITDGREAVTDRAFAGIDRALSEAGVERKALAGIGIAHSGVIESEEGVVLSFPRPGQASQWRNVPLRSIFEDRFHVPCMLEDSVRTMATAERIFGLGCAVEDFIYIEVGMGIAAAFFFNGRLYRGAFGKAGEFGHITVDEKGLLCSCGSNGCLETVGSCAAIIQAVRTAIEQGVDSKIRDLAAGDLSCISIELIARAAAKNDTLAFRVLNEAASYIAVGLADLVNLLNPRLIIFGGALFRSAPQLLTDPLWRIIRQRSLKKPAGEVELKVSPLGAEAGALGAARMMSERALERLYLNS